MKLDPGMHIGLHLVFFGKSGVTLKINYKCICIYHCVAGSINSSSRMVSILLLFTWQYPKYYCRNGRNPDSNVAQVDPSFLREVLSTHSAAHHALQH
jgi:hypothetical protein